MRAVTMALDGSQKLLVGLCVLGLAIGAGLAVTAYLLLTFGPQGASATHGGTNTVHACVSVYSGQARIMLPGQPPNCTATERLVDLAGGASAADPVYTVRTSTFSTSPGSSGITSQSTACLPGETAIGGGGWIDINGAQSNVGDVHFDGSSGPLGTPPTGWLLSFSWDNFGSARTIVIAAICAS